MKVYFLSSRPCALSINDLYFGITDKFERFAELSLKDNLFVRFTPENALSIGFFITENLSSAPPAGCEVYILKDALAIYARDFPPADFSLNVITQQRFDDLLATVYVQGNVQLSLESAAGFFTATLPPSFASCKLSFYAGLLFIQTENRLMVYAKDGNCLLNERFLQFSVVENTLNATLPLSDHRGSVAECRWELDENSCQRTECIVRSPKREDEETLPNDLLAYIFFESVLIGANFDDILSDELLSEKDKIVDFLGNFEAVIQTESPTTCGLLRKKSDRLYEAAYFMVEVTDGKITDIHT